MYGSYSHQTWASGRCAKNIHDCARLRGRIGPGCVAEPVALALHQSKAHSLREQLGGSFIAFFCKSDVMKSTDRILGRHRTLPPDSAWIRVRSADQFELQAVGISKRENILAKRRPPTFARHTTL